jgi:hypothetical protein
VAPDARHDEGGVWIPLSTAATEPAWDRDGIHSGIGGLALALDRVRRVRPRMAAEEKLATAIADRLEARAAEETDVNWFDGPVDRLPAPASTSRCQRGSRSDPRRLVIRCQLVAPDRDSTLVHRR